MKLYAYHGTNQAFEAFDAEFLGLANPNPASRTGFFFSMSEDTAWAYAHKAARTLVPQQADHEKRVLEVLRRAGLAERCGDHDLSERLHLEAEEIEREAMQADPAGARVLRCELVMENPLEVDGGSRAVVTNLAEVMSRARDAGHDGVIIRDILDTPSGEGPPDDHVAVFDAARIRILEVLEPAPREDGLVLDF